MTGSAGRRRREVDVLVVGAGPSGLTAAAALARRGLLVEVLERESEPGGVPRHCRHPGYGLRDLHRSLDGPTYARRLAEAAVAAGARVRTEVAVTGWADPGADPGTAASSRPAPLPALETTSATGLEALTARAVVLATGARERPRAARLVPGDRCDGIYTTGLLQQLVHLHGRPVGRRAVVVGAEHVSFSALLTLAQAGVEVLAMVTDQPSHQTWPAFRLAAALRYQVPVLTGSRVVAVRGRGRVHGVVVVDGHGRTREIACDTVVFTGDWVPDHELARTAGLTTDAGSRGPIVDGSGRTSTSGIFAVGNLVHPVETADRCALDGLRVATAVAAHLAHPGPPRPGVDLVAAGALRWLSPGRLAAADLAAADLAAAELAAADLTGPKGLRAWAGAAVARPRVRVTQDGRDLAVRRSPRSVVANRPFSLDASWVPQVDLGGGPVTVSL